MIVEPLLHPPVCSYRLRRISVVKPSGRLLANCFCLEHISSPHRGAPNEAIFSRDGPTYSATKVTGGLLDLRTLQPSCKRVPMMETSIIWLVLAYGPAAAEGTERWW